MRSSGAVLRRLALAGGLCAAACGGSGSGSNAGTLPNGYYIAIQNMAFEPANLNVPPGATVTVLTRDALAHSVTSETAPNAFDGATAAGAGVGGVTFDTGAFTGQRSFRIPSNAPEGTVIPYYCTVHMGSMATPNGTLTIRASAPPGLPAGGGGAGAGGMDGGMGGGGGGGGY